MSLPELFEAQDADPELVPRPHNVEVRLHLEGAAKDFLTVLTRVSGILPTREVIPGTAFARLRAGKATFKTSAFVELAGSDGERTARTVTDRIAVYVEGQVLVPAQRLVQILRRVPDPQVALEVQGHLLMIQSGRARWTVTLPKANELPVAAKAWGSELHAVDRETFLGSLQAVAPAVGDPQGRPTMAQVRVKDKMLLACDGSRVHRVHMPSLPPVDFSIPSSAIPELFRLLSADTNKTLELGANERFVEFEVGSTKLTIQQLAASFPASVESIITTAAISNTDRLGVAVVDLQYAVNAVRVNADPDRAQILLKVSKSSTKEGHDLIVHARDAQGNSAQQVIDCQWHGADRKIDLVLNKNHLAELLQVYNPDWITFHVGSDSLTKAGAIFAEDGETGLTVVLQQMRGIR